jgi:hypothetical protein
MAKLSKREQAAKKAGVPVNYKVSASQQGKSSKSSKSTSSAGIGKTSLEKMQGFDPSYFGTAFQDAYNQADPGTKAAINILGTMTIKQAQANEQVPVTLTSKEIKDLWKKAEQDPTIQQYYAEDLRVGTDALQKNWDLLSQDFSMLTDQEKQQYVDAKHQLDEAQAAAGTAYSGFREQAKGQLEKQTSDVIQSTRMQYQQQVNQLQQAFEQKYGSSALTGLGLNPLAAGQTTPIGMQSNWTLPSVSNVGYSPIGGLQGTAATSKLTDIQNQFNELEQETLLNKPLKGVK